MNYPKNKRQLRKLLYQQIGVLIEQQKNEVLFIESNKTKLIIDMLIEAIKA